MYGVIFQLLSEKEAAVPDTQASSCDPPSFITQCLPDMLTFRGFLIMATTHESKGSDLNTQVAVHI